MDQQHWFILGEQFHSQCNLKPLRCRSEGVGHVWYVFLLQHGVATLSIGNGLFSYDTRVYSTPRS